MIINNSHFSIPVMVVREHHRPRRRPRNAHLPPNPGVFHPYIESHERARHVFREYGTPLLRDPYVFYNRPGRAGELQRPCY